MPKSSNGEKLKRLPFVLAPGHEAGTLEGLGLRTCHFCVLWRKASVPLAIYLPSEIFSNIGFMEEFFWQWWSGGKHGEEDNNILPNSPSFTGSSYRNQSLSRPLKSISSFVASHPTRPSFLSYLPSPPIRFSIKRRENEKRRGNLHSTLCTKRGRMPP